MKGYCENDRLAVKKTSAANLFSSLLNLAHVTGSGSLPAAPADPTSADSRRHSNVDLAAEGAAVGGGTGKRRTGVADEGDMFLLSPHRLSHSQSVRSKQGPTRGSARAALMGATDCGGAMDSLPVGLAGHHRHRRSRSFVDFERALRSFRVLDVCTCVIPSSECLCPRAKFCFNMASHSCPLREMLECDGLALDTKLSHLRGQSLHFDHYNESRRN